MAKISDESVRRSKGVNLPGGIPQKPNNSITGDLSSIIENVAKDINNHIDKIYSGIDAIFDGLVDPSQLLLSESDKSLMSFVSGGQSISKNQSYSSKQTNIQQFAKSISENIKNTNKILTSDGMQVIVTNFNEQKLEKEKYKSNNTNNQINPVDLNNLKIKIDDLNLGQDSLKVLKDLSNALNSVAKLKYEVKDQNIVQYLTGIDKSISKIDINELKKKISKVNKLLTNDFLDLCNAINSASIDSKKTMSQLSSVVELMNAIPSIGEIDKQKMKTLKKNLRSIYWMTTDSNILTDIGITSKGLISAIIKNIVDRSKEAGQGGFKSVGALSKFIESLVTLGENTNVDRTNIMKTQMALWSLLRIYDTKGPIAYLTLQIKELGDEIFKNNVVGKNNSSLRAIEDMIEGISTVGDNVKFKMLHILI